MAAQLPAWQRCHWYVYVGVGVPVQLPPVAVRVEPSLSVPLTVGAATLRGAIGWITVIELAENLVADPAEFFAVTLMRSCLPLSRVPIKYVGLVAPVMPEHSVVPAVQRCQANAYDGAGLPLHVPVVAERDLPTHAVPLSVGGVRVRGAVAALARMAGIASAAATASSGTVRAYVFRLVGDSNAGRLGGRDEDCPSSLTPWRNSRMNRRDQIPPQN
jgi:hypothetical protein